MFSAKRNADSAFPIANWRSVPDWTRLACANCAMENLMTTRSRRSRRFSDWMRSRCIKLARNHWKPEEIPPIDGLAQFNTNYGDMTVNAYLAWDPASREAVAFDTGADCGEMLERVKRDQLKVKLILLTHSHPDHVADLVAPAKGETGAPVYISSQESARRRAIDRGRETFRMWRAAHLLPPNDRSLRGRNDVCRRRAGATDCRGRRFTFRRFHGRRRGFLSGRGPQ